MSGLCVGQTYVALSRATSLEGLQVESLSKASVRAHPRYHTAHHHPPPHSLIWHPTGTLPPPPASSTPVCLWAAELPAFYPSTNALPCSHHHPSVVEFYKRLVTVDALGGLGASG